MTENDKRNVRELLSSLVKSYELLDDSVSERYVEYNVGVSTKHNIKGLIIDLMRDFPSCSLRIKHDCSYHDYNGDNRCAICGNIIDEYYEDMRDTTEAQRDDYSVQVQNGDGYYDTTGKFHWYSQD